MKYRMNEKRCSLTWSLGIVLMMGITACSPSKLNSVYDPRFNEEGYLIDTDTVSSASFELQSPERIKVYIEVSGSMNGFFRANQPTHFKSDVWEIISYFSPIISSVTILTNDGQRGHSLSLDDFRSQMNSGRFVSTASTRVPIMLQSIFDDYESENNEVAILISDMKYSPVGNLAPDVLLTQYSTDISSLLGRQREAVCLVGATSNYLDRKKQELTEQAPYYYLITGKDEQVGYMRNAISTLLENNGHFVDNIESGFDYGCISHSFGIPDNCLQLENEPTFYGYDPSYNDTCVVRLNVNLENYRWIMATDYYLRNTLKVKALYGAQVEIGDVEFQVENLTDRQLKRTAVASIEIKVFNMPLETDVLEWTLQIPDSDYTLFGPYVTNANSEDDVTKSYSMESFIKGMFYGGITNARLPLNYILISKGDI